MSGLAGAAHFFGKLAPVAGDADGLIVELDRLALQARQGLEEALSGHDAFDALAFLRMLSSPWDFTGLKESDTRIETSQSAQDVVALAYLGMGLPRTPLTGENSGQPNMDQVVTNAAELVRIASARALIQGHQINEPLGDLAGEFLSYEISVRGRQYLSVATEFNSELLDTDGMTAAIEPVLGFTVADVRGVREAGVDLLNERFFGARDRVGDMVEEGVDPETIDRKAFLADMNLMINECRLFAAVTSADIAERAQIDENRAAAVLDFFSAIRPSEGDPAPVDSFVMGHQPAPWGSIGDDGHYLILNGFLGEDELRRDIERGLTKAAQNGRDAAKTWSKYERRRAAFAESKASEALKAVLSAEPAWSNQKFVGPAPDGALDPFGRESSPTEDDSRDYESDLLFVVDGVAFCVEVKAGSVTDKARSGNAKRLARDLEKTLTEGNEQADRLSRLIIGNWGVWAADGSWIDLSEVQEVHSIIVMLDDMGPLSLSMNELAEKGVIATEEVPWIVSLHDLVVISRTIDHPAQFLEYLRRRRGRKLATMVDGADELDMFMWFLDGGMYFDPNPKDVAAQVPLERPTKKADQRRFDEQPRVRLGTLTDPLDAWLYGNEGLSHAPAPKPGRIEEPWIEDYLATSEESKSPGWLRFGADVVGLSEKAQKQIGRDLRAQTVKARGGDRERSLTTHGTTSAGSWLLCVAAVPDGADIDHLSEYMDAKQYQTRSSRAMLLLYGTDGRLFGSRYRGSPEARTDQRDEEVALSPLRSLSTTFKTLPPSARRQTKQLRGKKGKRR